MNDKQLEQLHNDYSNRAERRGKKGGLGVDEVYRIAGLNQQSTLPRDPKQPYIRFVKAGHTEPTVSNRKVFDDNEVEEQAAAAKTGKRSEKKKSKEKEKVEKKNSKASAKQAENGVAHAENGITGKKRKKDKETTETTAKPKASKETKKKKESTKADETGSNKSQLKLENGSKKKKKALGEVPNEQNGAKKVTEKGKKKDAVKGYSSKEVRAVRLDAGEELLIMLENMAKESNIISVVGVAKTLVLKEKGKKENVHLLSVQHFGGNFVAVGMSANGKLISGILEKGSISGASLDVLMYPK